MTDDARTPVDVAVGILVRSDGAFLMTSRPEGKVYAGYWEFPGGKLESGESVEAALARELDEELGVHPTAIARWRVELVAYPHALVRLHFCKVTAWTGEFAMRERQQCAWQRLGALTVAPVLPGALPALQWMADDAGNTAPDAAGRPATEIVTPPAPLSGSEPATAAPSVAVRPAEAADAPAVERLLAALGYPGTGGWLAERMAALAAHADARVLVAVDGDHVLGVISLHFIPQLAVAGDFCRIAYLCVDAEARGRGIGALLEATAERLAVDRGCDRIELHSAERRTGAHRFYARRGYADVPKYLVKRLADRQALDRAWRRTVGCSVTGMSSEVG